MGKENLDEIDFNNPESFKKIVSEITKSKKKKFSFKNLSGTVIGFVMSNMVVTAIIAIYLLICGITLNVIWISSLIKFLIKLIS